MNLVARLLLPVAAIAAFAAPAQAESFRIPAQGAPAIEVAMQTGWTENYDDFENLTLFAQDGSGGLLFRMVEAGPNEPMPDSGLLAGIILQAAGAKPFSRREATSFAGGPAESFVSTMVAEDSPPFDIIVVLRKFGERHIAVGVKMIPQSTPADKRKVIEAQFAQARIVTR